MLYDMHDEKGLPYVTDLMAHIDYIDSKEEVHFDERGFIVMSNISSPLLVDQPKQWLGEIVYIKPKFRKTRALSDYYSYMFDNFEGEILGMVEVGTDHMPVVAKRGREIGRLFTFNKNTFKKDT